MEPQGISSKNMNGENNEKDNLVSTDFNTLGLKEREEAEARKKQG